MNQVPVPCLKDSHDFKIKCEFFKDDVMVGMYQLDQATWYPDIWLNILSVSVKVFLDEINV